MTTGDNRNGVDFFDDWLLSAPVRVAAIVAIHRIQRRHIMIVNKFYALQPFLFRRKQRWFIHIEHSLVSTFIAERVVRAPGRIGNCMSSVTWATQDPYVGAKHMEGWLCDCHLILGLTGRPAPSTRMVPNF